MKKALEREGLLKALLGLGHDKGIWSAALLGLLLVSLLGALSDFKNTAEFGQIDLRNRVVGARAMMLGHNPYTYHWVPGDSTQLLDPFRFSPSATISKVTVTPTVLAFHSLFAAAHYRWQKWIWLFVQLGLFFGAVWVAIRRARDPGTKAAVLLAGVMFSCSTFWRSHVQAGQVYVLFSFFAVLFISSFAWRSVRRGAIGGIILGVLVCLRPQMAMLGIPLLVYRRRDCLGGALAGLFLGIGSALLVSPTVWTEYAHAMMGYVQTTPHPVGPDKAGPAPAVKVELPVEVEEMIGLEKWGGLNYLDSSWIHTLKYLHIPAPKSLFLIILPIGIIAWTVKIFRLRWQGATVDFCAAKTLGLILFIDLVLPIPRMAYSDDILVVIVLMIFATRSQISTMRTWEWALILLAWFLSSPLPPWRSEATTAAVGFLVVPHAILIWAWFTPWRLPAETGGAPASPQSAPLAG